MPETWYQVDNVAKVFLASITRRDPRVFRVSCTLTAPVDPALLDAALARTAREQPQFQVTLHRGLFWHYLESSAKQPRAVPETLPPCAAIYGPDEKKNELLYRVSYYGCRINVEMFHALSDGNGGLVFLKSVVRNYLQLQHPDTLANVPDDTGASNEEAGQDSFRKYYTRGGSETQDPVNRRKSYRMRGFKLPGDQVRFLEAHLSVQQVLQASRAMGVTLTSFLAAAQMLAVYRQMPAVERGKAVSVSLPVNLRNYFDSQTSRNFFNSVRVGWVFDGTETLESLARGFDAKLRRALQDDSVKARMNSYEKLERMPGIKPVPLFIKNAVVGFFNYLESRKVTLTLSNMGRITVRDELAPYIEGFSAFCSSDSMFTTVCSYGDDLVLGTTWAYRGTAVLRDFYRSLADAGLDITLYATEVDHE